MRKIVEVAPPSDFRIRLTFDNQVTNIVDLAHLAHRGVFKAWNACYRFDSVSIGPAGELMRVSEAELCPDTLCQRATLIKDDQ